MIMETILNLISSYGLAATVIAYFLWKDHKFNDRILNVLTELRTIMAIVTKYHVKEEE